MDVLQAAREVAQNLVVADVRLHTRLVERPRAGVRLEHLDAGVMAPTLPSGVRRLPGLAERDALFADGLLADDS